MLLDYLKVRVGAQYISDLRYSDLWEQVLICMMLDKNTCEMFSLYDWQEALLYLKGERLESDDYRDYLSRLIL